MQDQSWIEDELAAISKLGLERRVTSLRFGPGGRVVSETHQGEPHRRFVINFASNDYLALSRHPAVLEAMTRSVASDGAGVCSSRLLSGTTLAHERLEQALAVFLGRTGALVFGAGYLANLGVLSALPDRGDVVIADRLIHASLLDGIRLSRAKLLRFRHNDVTHLEEILRRTPARRRFVVTESLFSMDGDLAPVAELAAVCARFAAFLVVDEAHALGVFGPSGAGCVAAARVTESVPVVTATLSKAIGCYGGVIAASEMLMRLLTNRARPFLFSTALPPHCAVGASAALELLSSNSTLGSELLERAGMFRRLLEIRGLPVLPGVSQIIPLVVGESEEAVRISRRLFDRGVFAPAIRPPTVPRGTARLRFSVTLAHDRECLEYVADTVAAVFEGERPRAHEVAR